jgi:hypothetical protein
MSWRLRSLLKERADQEGLIPAPVQTYLGRGTHSAHVVGGIGPTVLLLPQGGCAIRPPAKPGEELCFRC